VYKVLDTLTQNKTYLFYRDAMEAFLKGTLDIGNLRIGPWYYWMSGNKWEGSRFRFDLSTNRGFHQKLFLSGYAAYGTRDQAFKGGGEVKYLFDKDNWTFLRLSYKNDLDNGQVNYDQLGTDNIFGTIFRRPGIPYKFQQLQKKNLNFIAKVRMVSDPVYHSLVNNLKLCRIFRARNPLHKMVRIPSILSKRPCISGTPIWNVL